MQGSFSALLAGLVTYEFLEVLGLYLKLDTLKNVFLQGFIAGIAGILTWWLILELMGNTEIKGIRTALRHKFWKTSVIIPDKERM